MQQLWFIDKPITQHVSGTIVPIFRSSRLYTTACDFPYYRLYTTACDFPHYRLYTTACDFPHYVLYIAAYVFQHYRLYTTACDFPHYMLYIAAYGFPHYRLYTTAYGFPHYKCGKPYAVMCSLALPKMGTMVPETCWVIVLWINHNCCIKMV